MLNSSIEVTPSIVYQCK